MGDLVILKEINAEMLNKDKDKELK